ncbi:MAG: Asp-tRNA(Asn)/Glu-tRNA(Gln) amidotransferase subunit GatA [Chloroflexi bacterium]|nr:MAG: Asp-tRNA(Asn)/Glu-tRNA(Gln) amidotransferase subunit GatA [Chloroflexota bacterium]
MSTELLDLSVTELAPLLERREVSPVELVRQSLARIEALEPQINAYITVTAEQAMADAAAAEQEIAAGHYRGPFHGIPVGLKDLLVTNGVRTTGGSAVLADYVPDFDATTVEKLRAAGAISTGKLGMHEFAYGVTNTNLPFGAVQNPWKLGYIPGGSSGGSGAAVAAGECSIALGSDTGGSIRIPAACCGVVGLMPTYGRVSRYGALALGWSFDHVGPLAKTVRDAALMLGVLAGYDHRDVSTVDLPAPDYTANIDGGVAGLRIGVPRNHFFENLHPEVQSAVEAAIGVLAAQGAHVVEIEVPQVELSPLVGWTIVLAEAASYHEHLLRAHPEKYDPSVRVLLEAGEAISATKYLKAQRLRTVIKESFRAAMEQCDVIATPTLPHPACPHGQETVQCGAVTEPVINALIRCTLPFDVSGQPAIALPCGFTSDGLPISLQLAGRPFDEATICRAAHTYEAATDWHIRTPPLG